VKDIHTKELEDDQAEKDGQAEARSGGFAGSKAAHWSTRRARAVDRAILKAALEGGAQAEGGAGRASTSLRRRRQG